MGRSTPNRMVWLYFSALRRLVQTIRSAGEEAAQEDIALCLMLTVAVIETFLNLFFRVVVSEPAFVQHEELITRDLRRRASLDHKLRRWPQAVFGRPLEFDDPVVRSFMALKERRNALMHFTSTHETLTGDGFEIRGLADTSVFDDLTTADPAAALEVAEGMLRVLLRHRGIPEARLPAALHVWTGLPPLD
jgi:hypothetical protein